MPHNSQYNQGKSKGQQDAKPPDIKRVLENNEMDMQFIDDAEKYILSSGITSTQVRNIFSTIKKLELFEKKNRMDLLMLIPRLTYAGKKDQQVEPLCTAIVNAVKYIASDQVKADQDAHIKTLSLCCEAIVGFMPKKVINRRW